MDPYLPFSISNSKKGFQKASEAAYKEGFSKAEKIFNESYLGKSVAVPRDIRMISGNVRKINSGTSIIVHSVSNNPFSDKNLNDRIVLIEPKIIISKLKNNQVFGQSSTKAKLSDLIIGSPVNIIAYENIANLKEFKAKEIQIQSQGEPGVISTSTKLK